MLVTKLARVYAKALIDLATETNSQDEAKSDLDKIAQLIEDSRDFDNMLQSPVLKADKKAAVFTEIFKEHLSEMTMHFALLIIKNGREGSLAAIAQAYENIWLQAKGIERATLTTAIALGEKELNDLKEKVASATGSKIELENKVDPEVIGGMMLRVGDKQYNGTIAAELRRLKRDFKHNQYIAEF